MPMSMSMPMQSTRCRVLLALLLLCCSLHVAEAVTAATALAPIYMKVLRPTKWAISASKLRSIFDSSRQTSKYAFEPPVKRVTASRGSQQLRPNSRIEQELDRFMHDPPECCAVMKAAGSGLRDWTVRIEGPPGSLYAGEVFLLRIRFPADYPYKPLAAYFVREKHAYRRKSGGSSSNAEGGDGVLVEEVSRIPMHPHIYSNGDICLSVLGKDWRPGMTAESVVVSVLSLLASGRSKRLPSDNALHVDLAQASPGRQQTNWQYHDDNV